jgi:hypothetical protein
MTRQLLFAVALSLAPLAAVAQGIPQIVTGETMRAAGGAVTDAVKSNQELSDKEKTQPTPPATADKPQMPQTAPAPTPAPSPTPAR